MGIPSYFSHIVKNHGNIIKKYNLSPIKVNNLYLDCNSIIYDSVHSIDSTQTNFDIIISTTITKIEEYISLIKPDTNIFIAFDGVAPVAKMEQQRIRRYKSNYQQQITSGFYKSFQEIKPDPWNTTAITPGTLFMHQLAVKMNSHFNDPEKYGTSTLKVSCGDQYGEGEHKIFEYIRANPAEHSAATSVIYGLDADLIMLSINHLPISPNIYLFRETPHFIQSIDKSLEPNETYLMDIPELAKIITLDMNNGAEMTTEQQKNKIYDYIFICFMLGNDFLPHFPAVNIRTNGIEKLLDAYKSAIGPTENLTDGATIYWQNFRKFVSYLAAKEEQFMKNEIKLRDKRERFFYPTDTPENMIKKFDAIPTYDRANEKTINPYQPNWQKRYYTALFKTSIDDAKCEEIATNYMEGLEWTMKYYTTGCVDWRWHYKYNYPPLLQDLLKFIPDQETIFIAEKPPNPVTPMVQLCYVLPLSSLSLLPSPIYNKLIKVYNECYRNDFKFEWSFCRYFWESHIYLPAIDIGELERICS
jgi:5'-3' exonuclease